MFYVKKKIVFYEKPGCLGNKKQKELLKENGLELEVKSILDTKWDKKTLESFFIGLEKHEIVNESAPKIKKGEIDLNSITKEQLIYKMISDPILIKRPLIIAGESNICGFDIEKLNESLNLNISTTKKIGVCEGSNETCN
ncbi:ArsC/Spx/MgsR family protein [Arcobacter arenosus]|uniref:Arsenate reductase family protein n=1 Tax=Arcobacter arenosus TaxID=2576037 RepID=A0A5R8XZY9_9BACT|nr:ArsC/Spx/MgsR family protein [Arcobacter arenosus]TLP37571.1 hypothetical protein FDK22_09620 [Arcobacter arenosus]